MKGQYGKILWIDLTDQTYLEESPDTEVYQRYLGVKGFCAYLLSRYNPAGVDPLSPDNCLIFSTGPAAGSLIWGGCRYGVFTKSPQTGLFAESYSGGKVPEAIDAVGYDAVILQGRSKTPSVLEIHPGEVIFHEAGDLWGMETYDAEKEAVARFARQDRGYKKAGAVVIGPAGEKGVRFSVIANDLWRQAGRTGTGAVLGAKQVKAIVFQGDRTREVFDPEGVRALSRRIHSESRENPGVNAYKTLGTPQLVKVVNSAGAFPTEYWQRGTFNRWPRISADQLHESCEVTPKACGKCFMACGRMTTVRNGRHAGLKLEGPEYETVYAFGGLCLIDSIEEIAYLNDLCDRLGMDTISAGNLCAFTIEAVRRGRVDEPIDYGDTDAIAGLLRRIANREGIGDILAQGIRHAAETWGLQSIAVHVKGLEPAGYDPRVLKGMGLAYATSDRGACHLRSTFYKPELAGMIPPDQIEGKAEMFIDFEDRLALFDCLVLCRFYRDLYPWEVLGEIIHVLTGLDPAKDHLKVIAADVAGLIRQFNLRENMGPQDEALPAFLFQPLKDSGKVITPEQFEGMMGDYFRLRGWERP